MDNDVIFNFYKSCYETGLFTADDLKMFVEANDLTQEQANQILQPVA